MLGKDADDDGGALGRLRGAAKPEAHDLAFFNGHEVETLRLPLESPLHVLHRGWLSRSDRVPDVAVGGEVGAGLRAPDHPDRFSFPCRFA
jgi:hypothetical protein